MKPRRHNPFRLSSRIFQSIFFVTQKIVAPKSRREDLARREYILNWILLASILLSTIYTLSVFINILKEGSAYRGIPLLFTLVIQGIYIFLLYLSRKGYYIVAAYSLLILYLLPIFYCLLLWGLLVEIPLIALALIVIMTSILIHTKASFVMTGFITLVIGVIYFIHETRIIVPDLEWILTPIRINYIFELGMIFTVFALVTWLSNREIEKSLRRARRSEKELRQERDNIEIRIEQRTKELKAIQEKQVQELSNLAEFGRMSSGFFHDLTNPLSVVSLNIEQLKQGQSMNITSTQKYIEQAFTSTNRLKEFVKNIQKQLRHSDITNVFSLNDETYQAIEILGYRSRKQKVDITFLEGEKITTFGNPLKFHQMVVNLISNAIDAFEHVTDERKRIIKIQLKKIEDMIDLRIEDSGIGMDEQTLQQIFLPFFTTKKEGMGIGLATVKRIIEEDFHGTIEVESVQNEKTTFSLKFPHQKEPSELLQ